MLDAALGWQCDRTRQDARTAQSIAARDHCTSAVKALPMPAQKRGVQYSKAAAAPKTHAPPKGGKSKKLRGQGNWKVPCVQA